MLLILAFSSDFARMRFPFISLGFAFTFTGMIIYAAIQDVHAQIRLAYFATFMMCWGTAAPSVLLSTVSLLPHLHARRREMLRQTCGLVVTTVNPRADSSQSGITTTWLMRARDWS